MFISNEELEEIKDRLDTVACRAENNNTYIECHRKHIRELSERVNELENKLDLLLEHLNVEVVEPAETITLRAKVGPSTAK